MSDRQATWQCTSIAPQQTRAIGCALGRVVERGDVLAVEGPLGAGKTLLVRGVAEGMGLDPRQVTSPTYVIVQEYEPAQQGLCPVLVHVDAYRVHTLEELESIGWGERELFGGDAVVAVEWADRLGEELGGQPLRIELAHGGERHRELILRCDGGTWLKRWSALCRGLEEAVMEPGTCPICKGRAWRGLPMYPFCSKRCRMIDLGRWLGEDYRISRPIETSDLEEE